MSQTPPIPPPGTPPGYGPSPYPAQPPSSAGYPPTAYPPSPYQPSAFPPSAYPVANQLSYPASYLPQPHVRSPMQWRAYVRSSLESGQPVARMLAEMAVSGVPQQIAYGVIVEATRAMRRRAWTLIGVGVGAIVLGAVVTIASRDAAESSGGGTYVVWFGPIIFGLIAAIRGIYDLVRIPNT